MKRFLSSMVICTFCILLGKDFTHLFADGYPGEYIVTHRWHDLFSFHSPIVNPAFIVEENYASVRGAYAKIPEIGSNLWENGYSFPIGVYQTAGISWIGSNAGKLEGTMDWGFGDSLVSTSGNGTFQTNLFLLTYASNIRNRFGLGINLNLAQRNIMGENRLSPGIDCGISFRLLRNPLYGYHLIGANFQNLLTPDLSSDNAPKADLFTRNLRISWLGSYWRKQITSEFNIDVKDIISDAAQWESGESSAEISYSGKLGTWLFRSIKLYALGGGGTPSSQYWGLAAGLNIPGVNNGHDLEIDYQYNSLIQSNNMSTHTLYLRWDMGLHREEVFARKMSLGFNLAASDLYNRALSLYYQQRYWDAFFIFGEIFSQFPDFFKNDWVLYYMSSCQENLDMREKSQENYKKCMTDFASSKAVYLCDLGVMRIAYREGDNETVTAEYNILRQTNVPDSIHFHACYIMGQQMVENNDTAGAKQVLSKIPKKHPDYAYAQHTMGIIANDNGDTTMAEKHFKNAILAEQYSDMQIEIAYRSFLMLGYMYLENLSLPRAVIALRSVPSTSKYYDDALLGLGWASIKAQNWKDCEDQASKLLTVTQAPLVKGEAYLMLAYSKMTGKKFSDAAEYLQKGLDALSEEWMPSVDSIETRMQEYKENRRSYAQIAISANELALSRKSSMVRQTIDSLHTPQTQLKTQIDDYLNFADQMMRNRLLSKILAETKTDLEYALAKSLMKANLEKQYKEQNKIDEKIEKEKEKIRKLNKEVE